MVSSGNWPPRFKGFLETVFKEGRADMVIIINEMSALNDSLLYALSDEYVGLAAHEISSYIQSGLTVRCSKCGPFAEDAISTMCLASGGAMGNAAFLGPRAAALARGLCPGCGTAFVTASFDSTKISAPRRQK